MLITAIDTRVSGSLQSDQQDVVRASDSAPQPCGSRPAWCVVASYPKAERRAHAALHRFGFTAYLPLVTIQRPNRHYRTTALFPGYLFVQLDLTRPWSPVRYAPGVFQLLSTPEGIPTPCRAGAVEALQALDEVRASPPPARALWAPGTPCRLAEGPMAMCDAVVLRIAGDTALVSLMMLGHLREVAVSVDRLRTRDND